MNNHLKQFIEDHFDEAGSALDLGAGDLTDVKGLIDMGWKCEGADIKYGTDLEHPFLSARMPFDLVYSNFLLHKIINRDQFMDTIDDNLKHDGWIFIQALDKSDPISKSELSQQDVRSLLRRKNFTDISIRVFGMFDEEHGHWHRILEATAYKC